jgi:CheY-like chemotaxis protein
VAFRILIVDDDAGFLGLAAELLAERGFDVLGKAMDSAQALAGLLARAIRAVSRLTTFISWRRPRRCRAGADWMRSGPTGANCTW